MPASPERASRLRLALKTLLDDYQRQVDTLLPLRQLVKGSVFEREAQAMPTLISNLVDVDEHLRFPP